MMKKILIIDDDAAVTNYLMVFLMQTGTFEPTVVNDSREVAEVIKRENFDVLLLDMDMPNVSGLDILRSMREEGRDTPVVVLTGVSDVDLAVNAMKLGAFDYLIKPVDDDKLVEVLEKAIEQSILYRTIEQLPPELSRKDLAHEAAFDGFPSRNREMIRILHKAEKIAASDLGIFIWGESGTGKEAIASAIHRASLRKDRPFIVVDAKSYDPDKFPAFFFGQEKGWSGSRDESPGIIEQADHGTMFLNNIDALSLPMQTRLKRVIQNGEYYRESSARIRNIDVRMIVSSTRDLTDPAYADTFSRDLLYHLMVNSISIPPLRERKDDIPLLAECFLMEESEKAGKKITGFSDGFIELLMRYDFPDNVQELRTIIASAIVHEESDILTEQSMPSYIIDKVLPPEKPEPEFKVKKLDEMIRDHVMQTLQFFNGDKEKTAHELGITPVEVERMSDSGKADGTEIQ
ncbi:MAG TPA: sigma-54-dependent Fis family transcriptional regulator [Firmicutes bacterium]|nr:sigma-54-dependent Fis family transcriptional regulator [Bacillota bacterium]